jgi:hypothetical protein
VIALIIDNPNVDYVTMSQVLMLVLSVVPF